MKKIKYSSVAFLTLLFFSATLLADSDTKSINTSFDPAEKILDRLEIRYNGNQFSADFFQESPLPDLGISESAEGKAFFGKNEKFRWEYSRPDVLHYISDGQTLWIHSTEDNNVWIGKTASFFGKGSSAGLLTDIKSMRQRFSAELLPGSDHDTAELLLKPIGNNTGMGISRLFLTVSKKTDLITRIVTFNINDEETRIDLKNYNFASVIPKTLFNFKIPDKATIIPLD